MSLWQLLLAMIFFSIEQQSMRRDLEKRGNRIATESLVTNRLPSHVTCHNEQVLQGCVENDEPRRARRKPSSDRTAAVS